MRGGDEKRVIDAWEEGALCRVVVASGSSKISYLEGDRGLWRSLCVMSCYLNA